MATDRSPIDEAVTRMAMDLGDAIVETARGFAGEAHLGERFVYRTRPAGELKAVQVTDWIMVSAPEIARLVPSVVAIRPTAGSRVVTAEVRLAGGHPDSLDGQLPSQLGEFLGALHAISVPDVITEFEGWRRPSVEFPEWLIQCSSSYRTRLEQQRLDACDSDLIRAVDMEVRRSASDGVKLRSVALLHKDLHLANLLFDETAGSACLTGIIDWDAALLGPPEWEFAILAQRFPRMYTSIEGAYGRELDPDLIRVCGLVQALRFWKSFPEQEDFVSAQRLYIQRLLGYSA